MGVDVKRWLADKAAEIGLDENEKSVAEKLLTSKRFQGDFVGLPDFHSALDKQKQKFQEEYDKVVDLNAKWQDAYDKEYAPALSAYERLQKSGFNVDGLSDTDAEEVVNKAGKQGLTEEQIDKMILSRIDPVRRTALDYSTFVMDKGLEYSTTYNKPFKAADFRKFASENYEKYPTLDSAFDAFTAEDRKAKETKDRVDWEKAKEDEIRLKLMSTHSLPEFGTGGVGGEGAPFYSADTQTDDAAAREASRKAFAQKFKDIDFSKIST